MPQAPVRILLVEDDENLGDVLRSYLEMHDYDVKLAKDGEAGYKAFKPGEFDICIFDVMMPKKDGFTLARDVRIKDEHVPIIFLTAKNLKEDILQGFKAGADDYITKPFVSEELLMRIQAILRRSQPQLDPDDGIRDFYIGRYHFEFALRELTFAKGTSDAFMEHLSPKEAELLRLFAIHKNDVLTRKEALTKIWGEDNYFTARSMDVFVTKLRKYLKADDRLEIVNIHGNGFRLVERVEEV